MLAHRHLRKELLSDRAHSARYARDILAALRETDPEATLLDLLDALASRGINKTLWDALPDEPYAYVFDSEEALTEEGAVALPDDLEERITLHLGHDVLAIRTTVRAAWYTWPRFCLLGPETYNLCMYPDSLAWYVVRAGTYLYPMRCDAGPEPVLTEHPFRNSWADGRSPPA